MKNLSLKELQPLILEWAKKRNILFHENAPKQRLKLIEESGELASAILKNDVKLQKDAIGCANIAWNEIKDRKGKTVNGTFIKD